MSDKEIAALLVERHGYVLRKLPQRVKAVDEALAALGHKVKESATAQPDEERATLPPVSKRTVKKD